MSTDPLDEDNEGGGVESQPENLTAETAASAPQDDFATMPEPPAPPAFEVEPTPPKRPSLSSNPQHFDRNLEKLDDWVERTRQFEDKQIARKQQKDFLESRRAHNAEARKISAATGAQFNYDKDGVAQPRRDPLTGEQAFTKRISPVRWDEQGRPFQVIQNEQGTRSERIADPDTDAPIGPNPMDAEDKSIYRKTKYQPWEAIDPEEGINSKDGRVVKASAQALFDREKTALKRERDEISLRLRDPRRPNRLSPEARQKVEAELQGLEQPAPPPAEVKGMFGGVNIEATEAAKKKWQEGESLRAGLLNEKQTLLAADDERAGLESRAYELDQNLFSLEKTPLSQFVQERRKKKAESLAALDPEAARAEIENRGAAIAEEDAATETAIQDLQRRSAALNERTKKGITIQEMESVAAERAAIEADAASIEERVARRNAAAGEVMQGVEAIKAREDREREEQFAQLDRQAAKYPELSGEAKALRSVDSDYRARMQALQSQPEGEGKQAAIAALNQEFESKHREAATAYGSKLEKRMASEVGAAIEKVAGPGGALGFKSQIEALEKDSEIDPDVKKIASEAIREQAIDALIRSNNMGAVKQAVDRPEGQTFEEAYRISGYLDPQNKEDRAKAAKMLEQDPGLGAKIFDGFDRVMTTFGARIAGSVSAVGKAISYRLGLEPENLVRRAFDGGYQYKVETEKIREDFRDPRLETDDAVNRWIMPAVAEAVPNLAGMALAAIPVAGPGLAIAYNYGGLWDEAYSQASNDESLSEEDRQNAAAIYATLALPAETLGDVITGGIFTSRMIPKAVKKESASAALKFWSKFSNVSEVWDKMPPVLKRGVAVLAAGGTEGVTEVTQDKILDATIQFIKSGDIGASVKASLEDNRGALDTFIIASLSGGGIKTLETATRSIIEKGQDPEPMARRYAGVADSFRTENVVAFAEQAGVSFDTAEYEKLSEQSAGLSVRLDRINPKDKVARNDVARELASVNARRLTMISEILGKESVDQAMAGQGQQPPAPILPENIAAMQAEIGQAAPERQAPLASAIKILSGAPIDSLTKAEQDAIKPHMAKVGGQTVLTDDILTELSQTSPQAAALMQQGSIRDEATQRLEILSTEKEGGETNEEQIQQKGPENVGQGIQSPENASQNDQGIGTGTLTTGGAAGLPSLPPLPVGRGGALISKKEKKVADTLAARLVQAGADKNASQKFADYFIKRETLKGWGTEKLNAAVIEFQKAGGMQNPQAILASIQASDATQGAEIDNFTNEVLKGLDADPKAAAIQPQERAKVATIIRNQIAPSLLRYRPVLQGIVSYFDKTSDSDLQVNRAEKLLINSAALLSARGKDFWANTENADVIIDEEIAHISQIKVIAEIRRERTGEEGAEDMDLAIRESEEIFLQLPQPLQEASRKIYGDDKATPGQSGMEFFRQMLQGDIAISEGRVLDRNGKVLTELAANDRPWIEKMKSMFERLFKVFTDLRGNLGTMLRDEGRSEAEVEELTARVERIRKDSLKFFQNLKKEGDRIRGEAYGQEYARQTAQYTAAQPGGREGAGRASSGGLLPTTADGRPSPSPSGTDGRNAPAGNALGQDQAARLAELEGREAERQAREERAKERRAEYVATRAGDLKNYEKVVESTPEDAREPVRQLLGQAPSGKTGYVLAVNQRRLPSTWVALPPGVVQTSHIGPNFQKNPEYAGQNTRAYDTDPAEQNKVRAGALPGALNEDILTSTDPSSANSAPQVAIVIDAGPDGQPRARWQAAGGNAREMMSNLAPQEDQDRLSQTWSEKGAQFGFEAVPEGFRGYRFLGTFDIRTEAGARDYQKLVDDLNPATGVVQDVSDRADLDAKNIPLDLVGDLPVMMSGKEAVEGLSRLLTAPGNIVERNRIEPMVKNPAQAQAYMQRMMFTAGLGQPKLTGKIADYQLQNRNAAFVELSADSAKAAIALRQNGNPGIADALGGLLSNVADYLDEGRSLKTSLELASSQIEMDAMVGDTAPAVEITKRLVELVVVDKRGRVNSEATSAAMKDYMVALASGISRASEDAAMGDMFGAPMTMAERLAAINAAHRRQPQPDSETTLSAATSRNARRMRELELKRRQEGLTRYESDELARLEQSAGQQFMDFFEEARDQRFELEQEVERRGIERAPVEQMDLVLSAAPSFNRTKAAARLKESTRQRKKDTQSRIEELKKAGGEYPHRMDGNWRSDWKITSPGRKLRAPNSGAEFIVQSINIPEDKVTLVRASSPDQPGLTMGIKEAQKRFEVELNAEELEIEPYFISRLTDMAQMKKDFDRAIENIAAGQKKARALIPPLKGAPRGLEKIGGKLKTMREGGKTVNLEKLVEDGGGDILRASVVVDTADQIQQTIADILHTFAPDSGNTASTEQQDKGTHIYTSGDGMVKIWMEDRFNVPLASGYSDINIKIQLLPGYWAELQVHIPEMLVVKEGFIPDLMPDEYRAENLGVPNGVGHKLYEEYRAPGTTEERKAYLEKQMAALYALAIRKYLSRTSANSSQVTSRTKGAYGLGSRGSASGTTLNNPGTSTFPSGVVTFGVPSSSQNFAPSGNISRFSVSSFIPSSPTREAATSQPVSTLLNLARKIATKAHKNQFRKDGKTAYIEHIRDVVNRLENADENIRAAAWLHDVVEDNPNYNFQEIKRLGVPEEVIAAVRLLTKSQNQSVASYFRNIRPNPIATAVKIADMLSNLADDPSEKQRQRYQAGLKYLQIPTTDIEVFNQDTTLAAARSRRKASDDQLAFDFEAPAVQEYKTALEADGITHPVAQAAAAQQDIGLPATEALDLFSYQAAPAAEPAPTATEQIKYGVPESQWNEMANFNDEEQMRRYGTTRALLMEQAILSNSATPTANPLTAPEPARIETQTDERTQSSPLRGNETPQQPAKARGTPQPAPDGVLGDLFSFMAGVRASERDSAQVAPGTGARPQEGGGVSEVDGRQGDSVVQRPIEGDGRSGDVAGTLPVSGGLGGQRGRTVPATDSRPGRRILQPGNGLRVERPPVGSPERNISLTRDQALAPRGTVGKLRANLAAIRIIQSIDSESRLATAQEKEQLVKFSGWGALSQVFDDEKAAQVERGEIERLRRDAERYRGYVASNSYYETMVKDFEEQAQSLENWKSKWYEAHKEVRTLLSDQEYRDARRSTINAHFTSPEIVAGMWDIIEWMGFKGGNILEPGAGIGHFFGLMPEKIADRSKLFGVELDAYTSKILKALYPEADIQNTGFQTADIADNSIDLAISNVPFANIPVRDPALEAMGGPTGNLHDYFFGKSLTKLKPGGIQVFITSAFTMDKGNPEIRKWLAERADLVAAYRLPNDAFRENAGTDVVTDIIILRKKDGKPFPHAKSWVNLDNAKTRRGEDIRINEYFATHPQNILGQLDNDGSMYGDDKEMTVHGDPARPPAIAMQQDLARLPQGILGEIEATGPVRTGATGVVKVGNIIERDGKFYRQGQEEPDAELNDPKATKRVRRFLTVRDALNRQYDLELSETATDEEIEANRRALNTAYDQFLAENGYIHDSKNKKLFLDDPDYFRLLGAEIEPKTNRGTAAMTAKEIAAELKPSKKKTYTKADIFARRVLVPRSEPTRADTLADAYGVSLGWRGRVDTQFIGQLTDKTPEQVETQLLTQEIAVRDPDTGSIVSREQYLAGNVRKKLAIARAAGPDYARNVRLLEAVQPQRVGINDIRFNIGATWIPADIYNRFLQSLGVNSARFVYVPTRERSSWERDKTQEGRFGGKIGVDYKQFQTTRVEIEEIMDSLLNLRAITLRLPEKEGGGIDMGATTAARERAKLLDQRFQDWARETPDVAAELEERFNTEVNAFVQRTYDGQFLQFPWANKDFDIYPDKKNTIWRALQEGFGLIAHGVGGGKTIIGSAIALEMRRLGMARKPMIVVHNATLEGFASEISKMAPTARVLVGRKDELTGDKRKEFLMRIAAGDWDAVVIAHSTFGMIEDDPQVEIRYSNSILDEAMASLRERGYSSVDDAKKDRKKAPTVKALVKQIERLENFISEASKRRTDTGLLNFQQLGVDALIVDEVHKFKKMPFSTQLEAKGIDGATSKRAYNLLMRARQIQERMGGKNVFSMTGTPVTNTLGEIWNMVRLVAPNVLKEWNVELFDQFVSKFAQVVTEAEMGPTGEFKNVDRLARFVNLPEWNTFLRQAADVKLGDDLVVKNRPGIKGGRPELVALPRSKGVSSWVAYIRRVLEDFSNLSGDTLAEKPSLMAVPVQAFMASRAAAIDIRLINPRAKDEPDSKVNRMVERLMALYRQSTEYSGTQVIFADSFNSVRTSLFEEVTSAALDLELDPSKPEGTTFNLYEDIRQKLIAQGIPASEIAVITDSAWNSDKKKQALFDMVNEGKVRVIIGSTERLGTGVNMQRLMLAAHHLDVPWTPAELEQRDGRVFRQGNIHGELKQDIELIRYGMSDTLDAALWQKLETKQRFSNAALSGKVTGRELAEDKGTMTLEEQRAVLSGKYGRRLWEITSRLQELDISRNANQREAETRAQEIRIAQRSLEATEAINARSKPSITKMRALAENIAANGTIVSVDGKAFNTKAETAEAVKSAMEAARGTFRLSFDGKATADPVTSVSVNGVPIHLHPIIRVDEQYNEEAKRMEPRTSISFELLAFPTDTENDLSFGTVTSPATLLSRLEELGETTTGIETGKENNISRLRSIANMGEAAAWPFQTEYDALTAERVEVEKLYNADLKGSTPEEVSNDTTLAAARRQTYDPNQLELDFDAAPRDQAAAQEDSEKSAADRFQSGLDSVMALAASYANIPGVDMDEVRQTARIALADAARSFDPSRAVPFGPYASIVVRNRLNGLYRRENLRRERIPQSLDEPMPGDFTETRQDYTPDIATPDAPTMASRNEARRLIDEMISTLPERMRAAVDGYLQQRQQDEIGEQFGISKQAVSRLQQEGFKRLRQKMTERGIGSVAELLTAATGTPQDDGDFIEPGESFESDLENLLNDLNGVPADIDNAVEKQEQAALEEGGGQRYKVGRPDLAFGANNPDVRGLDQFYTDRFLPETEAQWETAARDMVAKDFEGTRRSIEQAGLSGQTISPELTKAADQIANSLRQKMLQTGKDEDRRAFNVFWYAYRATGTEAGRALASRRDPFKTPAMRHREFLLDLMLTPGKKDKKEIDAETDPAKKAALIDRVTAALLQKLKDAGITPEDILGNRVVVGLNNAEIQRQFRAGLTPKQAEVFDLLLRKNQTPAQIAQRTGMKPEAVEAVFTAFKNRMRQQHLAKFKAGIHKQSEVTLGAAPTQSGLFGGEVSDAEAEAAFDQWFSGMVGTSDTKKIGRPKFRLDDPAHVMRLARAIQSARGEAGLGDMAYEWWIMNILSGPQTQSTNIAGNAGFLVLDTTLQRGVEALVNVFVRDKKAARLGEFRALARGILPGITKGLSMAAKAWSAEHDFYEHTVLGTPLELGQWDKLGNTRAAIPGKAGRVIRIPGRALLFADSFFKQLAGQMNVAAFAYRIAKAEGLRGQALTARVAQLSKTRGEIVSENLPSAAPSQEMVEYFARQLARRDQSLDFAALVANRSSEAWELAREQAAYDAAKNAGWSEDAWVRAVEKSKELTFQQDLKRRSEGGSLFEDAAAKIQDARFNNQLIGFFFPFVKTPYNIFRTGIRKSPLGSANLAWQAGKGFLAMKDGKAFLDGDPTLVRDLSEQLIAWTAMALIFGAVQGDEDDDDKMLLITGSQPRSEATAGLRDLNARATGGEYVIRIGGRNGVAIPYGRFDPIATVLGTTVDLIRSIKRNGTPTESLASVWNYMVAQTNSKTFLQGIANIATILEGKSDPVGATQRTLLQALVPNIIRQPLRNLDDYVRDTKTAPAIYTLLPKGDLAEPKVDVYGNEIRKGSNPVMRLFFASPLATEPVLQSTDELLMNWNRANPSMAYAPEQAKAVYKGRDGKEKEMTAEETSRYRLAAGRLASVKLRAVATPSRVANPTEADIEAVRNAFSEARREVRERMFAGR